MNQPRRQFLQTLTAASSASELPYFSALGATAVHTSSVEEELVPPSEPVVPRYSIRFAVCGISHGHIYGMVEAIKRGGGVMVKAWAEEPELLAAFRKRYPDVPLAGNQD